jgi:hypothetical protein
MKPSKALTIKKYEAQLRVYGDYVFEDNYQLLPLNEVEKYYKTHKHLPDIPPSSEIEINGLDLGKIVSLQMKKIEELTIHMVEMQKEIERLKSVSK